MKHHLLGALIILLAAFALIGYVSRERQGLAAKSTTFQGNQLPFAFEYPKEWGNIYHAERATPEAKKDYYRFDGFSYSDWLENCCAVYVTVQHFNEEDSIEKTCHHGACTETNLFKQQEEIERGASLRVDGVNFLRQDSLPPPGALIARTYTFFLNQTKYEIVGIFLIRDLDEVYNCDGIDSRFCSPNEKLWQELSAFFAPGSPELIPNTDALGYFVQEHPEFQEFTQLTQDLEKLVLSIQFAQSSS